MAASCSGRETSLPVSLALSHRFRVSFLKDAGPMMSLPPLAGRTRSVRRGGQALGSSGSSRRSVLPLPPRGHVLACQPCVPLPGPQRQRWHGDGGMEDTGFTAAVLWALIKPSGDGPKAPPPDLQRQGWGPPTPVVSCPQPTPECRASTCLPSNADGRPLLSA